MKYLLRFVVVVVVVFGNSYPARSQTEVTLLAPSPIRTPLNQLIAGFEAKTGHQVKVTWGTGISTKQQVARGEVSDVSIVVPPYEEALASGNIVKNSATVVARFITAVAVRKGAPKPDISTPEAVKRTLLAAKSISYVDPALGSAGYPVVKAFEKLGIAEQMKPKSRLTPGGGGAMDLAAKGETDFCLLYLSDIHNPGLDVVGPLPRAVAIPLDWVGYVSASAKNPAIAKALLDYISSSPDTREIYKAAGMEPTH